MSQITKEKFCKIMDDFIAERDIAKQMDNLLDNSPVRDVRDFFSASCLHFAHEPLVVELLSVMFDDGDELIEYWMYEMDFGREWYAGCMKDTEGNDVMLADAESLYDYLIENMQ